MIIQGYHAHVYFDAATLEQARALCEQAREKFALEMGRSTRKTGGAASNVELPTGFQA